MIQRAFLIGFVALAGCGTSASGICGDVCDCTGCSEKEEADCVDSIEDSQKAAEDEGCEEQYDTLLSCYGDQLECRDSELDVDGCDSEEEELSKCAGSGLGGIGGSVCDRAAAICAAEAGEGTSDGGQTECSGTAEAFSRCVVDAGACDSETLTECVSSVE